MCLRARVCLNVTPEEDNCGVISCVILYVFRLRCFVMCVGYVIYTTYVCDCVDENVWGGSFVLIIVLVVMLMVICIV